MRKIPREAIKEIRFGNQCDIYPNINGSIDILKYERNRTEECIIAFVKRYIKIKQREVKPGTYETIGSIIVIDQDKIERE